MSNKLEMPEPFNVTVDLTHLLQEASKELGVPYGEFPPEIVRRYRDIFEAHRNSHSVLADQTLLQMIRQHASQWCGFITAKPQGEFSITVQDQSNPLHYTTDQYRIQPGGRVEHRRHGPNYTYLKVYERFRSVFKPADEVYRLIYTDFPHSPKSLKGGMIPTTGRRLVKELHNAIKSGLQPNTASYVNVLLAALKRWTVREKIDRDAVNIIAGNWTRFDHYLTRLDQADRDEMTMIVRTLDYLTEHNQPDLSYHLYHHLFSQAVSGQPLPPGWSPEMFLLVVDDEGSQISDLSTYSIALRTMVGLSIVAIPCSHFVDLMLHAWGLDQNLSRMTQFPTRQEFERLSVLLRMSLAEIANLPYADAYELVVLLSKTTGRSSVEVAAALKAGGPGQGGEHAEFFKQLATVHDALAELERSTLKTS